MVLACILGTSTESYLADLVSEATDSHGMTAQGLVSRLDWGTGGIALFVGHDLTVSWVLRLVK